MSNTAPRISEGTELADTALESFEANGEEQTERFIARDLEMLRAKGGSDYVDFMNRMQEGLNHYSNTNKGEAMKRLYYFAANDNPPPNVIAPVRDSVVYPPQRPPPEIVQQPNKKEYLSDHLLPKEHEGFRNSRWNQALSQTPRSTAASITSARDPINNNSKSSPSSNSKRNKPLKFGKSGQISVKGESVIVGIGAVIVIVSAITMILSRSKDAPTYTALVPIGGALLAIGAAYNGYTEYEAENKRTL